MKKEALKFIILLLIISGSIQSQNQYTPTEVATFDPIVVQKPILLDSMDLNGNSYSDNNLLNTPINFPDADSFSGSISADSAGFFRMSKPKSGYTIRLVSFHIASNRYGKGRITVTSPNPMELWIDNVKRATKYSNDDSVHLAGSVDAVLNGFINNSRIVIKILSSSSDKNDALLKINVKPDNTDSTLSYVFNRHNRRRIDIKDILEGKRVNHSSISPSGRFVLLFFRETKEGGKSRSYTEVFDTQLKKTIFSEPLIRSQLSWMPKSDLLYYTNDDEKGRTLYTFDPLSAETNILAEQLPKETFFIAHNEQSLFYSSRGTVVTNSPTGLKRLIGIDDRQSYYRDRSYINQYFFETGHTQQITFGKHSARLNDVSKDMRYLLFSVSNEDLSQRPFSTSSLYRVNLVTMQTDTIWENERYLYSARFSPDGNQLLIHGAPEAFNGIGLNIKPGQIANSYDTQSFIMNLEQRSVTPITKTFNPTISTQLWNPVDQFIYYRVEEGDRVCMYRYSPRKKSFEKLPLKEDVISSFSIANNAQWATYTGVSSSNSSRSYLLNLKTMKSTLISDPYANMLNQLELGEVIDWSFKSSFGDLIDGRYYLPPYFNPNKKYPLIVYYYGGTSPSRRIFESTYPLHVYAAQDYVVLTLQPSGTTGYGQEFSARHVNAWGKQTADEIIEGVKAFVETHPFVDGTKIGNIGASYGGFMTQYLITQTDLFTASVSHAGISNITSYWGEGYWGYSYSAGASADSYPWNNPKLYVQQSPLFHADKINTPLLLLHGTADTNVPSGESIQMYTALKLLNKQVELILVEGENHAIYDYQKRINWNHTIFAWFAKWLKDDARWWESIYSDE